VKRKCSQKSCQTHEKSIADKASTIAVAAYPQTLIGLGSFAARFRKILPEQEDASGEAWDQRQGNENDEDWPDPGVREYLREV
jgi:hypothetical protein